MAERDAELKSKLTAWHGQGTGRLTLTQSISYAKKESRVIIEQEKDDYT